jgi:hypothetical protein
MMQFVDKIFWKVKTGAASRIVLTPSASSGQALRKVREEWVTHFVVGSGNFKSASL